MQHTVLHNIHYTLLVVKPRIFKVTLYLFASFVVYLAIRYLRSSASEQCVPEHLRQYLKFEGIHLYNETYTEAEIEVLRDKVTKLNKNPELLNWVKFGVPEPEGVVLVVRVHRDLQRLQLLVAALAQVRDIQHALIVFSHSYYHTTINSLIQSISFCKVTQIFYPYSVQLYPNKFPGPDPTDCTIKDRRLANRLCTPRNASLTETKQHWWWMANMVFSKLSWSQAHKGFVVFLAEDDYVVADMLHMLQYAQRSLNYLPEVEVIALGRPYANNLEYNVLNVDSWAPPFDRGLAFNKSFWKQVEALSSFFCMYDDSSWSYSLLNLFGTIGPSPVDMVLCEAPRVMSTAMFPSGRAAVESICERLHGTRLFPARVRATLVFSSRGREGRGARPPPRGDGGWRDLRDQLLCLDPLLATTADTVGDDTTTPPTFTTDNTSAPTS